VRSVNCETVGLHRFSIPVAVRCADIWATRRLRRQTFGEAIKVLPTRELFGLTNVCRSVGKFTYCLRTKVDANNMSGMRLLAVGRCPLCAAELFLSKITTCCTTEHLKPSKQPTIPEHPKSREHVKPKVPQTAKYPKASKDHKPA